MNLSVIFGSFLLIGSTYGQLIHPDTKSTQGKTSSNSSQKKSLSFQVEYDAPSSTSKVSQGAQVLWLALGYGKKFKAPEDSKLKQVIAINPYLSPEKPFLGEMIGMQTMPDGSILLAGTGGLDPEGGTKGVGWWKITPEGSISSWVSRPLHIRVSEIYPNNEFSITKDGSILMSSKEGSVIKIKGDGEIQNIASGFKKPGKPIQDSKGNIWVAVGDTDCESACKLLKISTNGTINTVIDSDKTWSNKKLPGTEKITLGILTWDPTKEEIVSGGSFITAKPHSLHSSIWRISTDGHARKVFYSTKGGQGTDGIQDLSLDNEGRIIVGVRIMNSRARQQLTRLHERSGKLTALTGSTFQKNTVVYDHRPGHEEAPYDGPASNANIRKIKNLCTTPDGTIYFLDEHQLRRLDKDGIVRTWAY